MSLNLSVLQAIACASPVPREGSAIVEFYGDRVTTVRKDGTEYAAMKPICEALGLDWKSQHRKIVNDERYGHYDHSLATSGGDQAMTCIPVRKLAAWLFSVHPNKVAPELKSKLVKYQEECAEALHDYWTRGWASRFPVNPPENIARFAADLQNRLYFNNEPVLPEDWIAWYFNCGLGSICHARVEHGWAFRQGTHYHQVTGVEANLLNLQISGIHWLRPLSPRSRTDLYTHEGVKMLVALMSRKALDDLYLRLADTYFGAGAARYQSVNVSLHAALERTVRLAESLQAMIPPMPDPVPQAAVTVPAAVGAPHD